MRTVLLTGGTGFIGYNIALELLKCGYYVRILTRRRNIESRIDSAEYVYGNVEIYEDVLSAMEGCSIVVHVAGMFTFDLRKRKEIYKTNVLGTENICRAVLALKIERLIYTSSAATIGKARHGLSDETTSFNLWRISSPYKKSKVFAENVVLDYYKRNNLPVVILNPSLPLGEYDFTPTPTGMMIKSFLQSQAYTYIEGGFNFVHVKDVAKAHLLAIQNGRLGERYIIGNENITLSQFYTMLSRYNKNVSLRKLPWLIALIASFILLLIAYAKKREPSITPWGVLLSRKKMFYNNNKSIRELGVVYTPIEKAIEDSVMWFTKYRHKS